MAKHPATMLTQLAANVKYGCIDVMLTKVPIADININTLPVMVS